MISPSSWMRRVIEQQIPHDDETNAHNDSERSRGAIQSPALKQQKQIDERSRRSSPNTFQRSMREWGNAVSASNSVDYSDPQHHPLRETQIPTKLSLSQSNTSRRTFLPKAIIPGLGWSNTTAYFFFYRTVQVFADHVKPFEESYEVLMLSIVDETLKQILYKITSDERFFTKETVVLDARYLLRHIEGIRQAIANESSSLQKICNSLCQDILDQFQEDASIFLAELEEKKFTFHMLPYLLTYDLAVVTKEDIDYFGAQIVGCRFRTTAFDIKVLEVCTSVVKCSGMGFFSAIKMFTIRSYHGAKPLNHLSILPLEYATSDIRDALLERGSTFRLLGTGMHHYNYKGYLFGQRSGFPERFLANGRVMIDGVNFCRRNPMYRSHRCIILDSESPTPDERKTGTQTAHDWRRHDQHNSPDLDGCYPWIPTVSGDLESDFLPDEMIFKTWPFLPAFSFTAKKWGEVRVSGLMTIRFRDSPLNHIVMDEEKKRLIQAIVEQKDKVFKDSHNRAACILLFHGKAGVGKSVTAEAVAEHLRLPLFRLSAGELGINPTELRHALEEVLELASAWKAVLLIDDVDVLLESRKEGDIRRNAMKDTFLRLIESFHGIMFLTTNRVTDFDEAFQNRLTVALQFDQLDIFSRERVWHSILQSNGLIGKHSNIPLSKLTTATQLDLRAMDDASDDYSPDPMPLFSHPSNSSLRRKMSARTMDGGRSYGDLLASAQGLYDLSSVETHIPALAQYDLNGRQIRMVLRLAKSLSLSEGAQLSAAHIERVVSIAAQFNLDFI
eukprot:TRINITY_DN6380_c0_g1_i1.p1 TRINITY_DN6380_c0_g1~~TRINITY_DN6380_c0_g1_i1.p1  ORF type:complete len:785 (-),score=169.87 TRINITY_DN6380_c0_g1_i1:83-2437(-)